jgi:undecaprenyl-diphosphatase
MTMLSAIGLVLLTVSHARVAGPEIMDRYVDGHIRLVLSPYRPELQGFIRLAKPSIGLAVSAVTAGIGLALGHRRLALVVFVGPLLTGAATILLKPAVGRTLDGEFSLPSGHTAGVTAVATAVALLAITLAGRRIRPIVLLSLAGVVAAGFLMACALIVNQLHYFSDTVAGFLTAVVVMLGTALGLDFLGDCG